MLQGEKERNNQEETTNEKKCRRTVQTNNLNRHPRENSINLHCKDYQ